MDDFMFPPVEELHQVRFNGLMEYHQVFRYNSWCYIAKVKPDPTVRFHVTPYSGGKKTCSQVSDELNAQLVINGGDFDMLTGRPVGLHVSEGTYYGTQVGQEPYMNFTIHNFPQINAHTYTDKWNSIAGKRFIVRDGKLPSETSQSWTEEHPRTLVGVTADGWFICCIIDGRQEGYSHGVDLYQASDIMMEFGANRAIDWDGGGSAEMVLNGIISNFPSDGDERPVGNHLAVFIGGTPMDIQITTKGTVNPGVAFVNVKSAAGGTSALYQMFTGDSVYGYMSSQKTDIFFDRIYRKNGTIEPLTQLCKSIVINSSGLEVLKLDPASAYPGTAPPIPTPVGTFTATFTVTLTNDDTGETWAGMLSGTLTKQ